MNCLKCKSKTKVTESFSINNKSKNKHLNKKTLFRLQLKLVECIVRRRKCTNCNYTFITYESPYEPLLGF